MKRSLKILVFLTAIFFVICTGAAQAFDPIYFFVVGQLINDQRQAPIEHYKIGLNPTYNVFDPRGNFVGCNPDGQRMVCSVGRGATVEVNPGECGDVEIVGVELNSNEPNFSKISRFRECLKGFGEVGKDLNTSFLTETAPGKFILSVSTADLDQRLYVWRLTTWFVEQKAMGLFKTGRRGVVKREETVIRIIILDPEYMAKAVANPEIQAFLRSNYGLMAIPYSPQPQKTASVPLNTAAPITTPNVSERSVEKIQPLSGEIVLLGEPGASCIITAIEKPSGLCYSRRVTMKSTRGTINITGQPGTFLIRLLVQAGNLRQEDKIGFDRFQAQFDITPGKKYLRIGGDPEQPGGISPHQLPPGYRLEPAPRDMEVISRSGSGNIYKGWIEKGDSMAVRTVGLQNLGNYSVETIEVIAIARCGNHLFRPVQYAVKVKKSHSKIIEVVRTNIIANERVIPYNPRDNNFTATIAAPQQGSVERETPAGLWSPNMAWNHQEFNTPVNIEGSSANATGGNAAGGGGGNSTSSSSSLSSSSSSSTSSSISTSGSSAAASAAAGP